MYCGEILKETADYLVLNKAPGVSIHSENGPGLIQGLREQMQKHPGHSACSESLYPVHRLDKVTSGLLLLAKTPEANRQLSLQFQRSEVDKFYLALIDKKPRKTQGEIRGSMIKARNGSWRLARDESGNKNLARTQFKTWSYAANKRFAILRPLTGKTHQLRVALKALGAPIRGDARYGGNEAERCYLHAWYLRFNWQGEEQCLCTLPERGKSKEALEEGFFASALQEKLNAIGDPFALSWPSGLASSSNSVDDANR